MNKRLLGILILVGVIFLILIGLTVYLVQQQQTLNSNAAAPATTFTAANVGTTPTTSPLRTNANQLAADTAATATPTTACTTPNAVSSVKIVYPYQDTTNHVFYDEANCTWDSLTGIDSYSVKVTNVGTGTVVSTQTVSSAATNLVFQVQQGGTYKCEVSGVNACGAGPIGADQEVCQVDGLLPTGSASGTLVPTATTVPALATPTTVPLRSLPNTGSVGTTLMISIIGTIFVAAGGALLFGL